MSGVIPLIPYTPHNADSDNFTSSPFNLHNEIRGEEERATLHFTMTHRTPIPKVKFGAHSELLRVQYLEI